MSPWGYCPNYDTLSGKYGQSLTRPLAGDDSLYLAPRVPAGPFFLAPRPEFKRAVMAAIWARSLVSPAQLSLFDFDLTPAQ
jgi:hypothetical protein